MAPEKTEGPGTTITFLGIEIDTVACQLCFPQGQPGCNLVPHRSGKKDLLSLIGFLNHAATLVRHGQGFLCSIMDALQQLNVLVSADISWLHTFIENWNGNSLVLPAVPAYFIMLDASGTWGCGALHSNQWLQVAWPPEWVDVPIVPKELVPIVLVVALWGT